MKLSLLPLFALGIGLALTTAGCAVEEGEAADEESQDLTAPKSLTVNLTIDESKVVFSTRLVSFAVKGGDALDAPCRDRSFFMTSKPSLYAGWSVGAAAQFSESAPGAKLHEYVFSSCRAGDAQVVGWFGKERDLEFTVGDQFLDSDYDAKKLPLILQYRNLTGTKAAYYSCDSAFTKTLVRESENAKRFDLAITCKARKAPTKGQLGPLAFLADPGPYAAVASYRSWMLPSVASTPANFKKVRDSLLGYVPKGSYTGAMSTLGKPCSLRISDAGDSLIVEHTITSSNRTRRLELKAADLLGFDEGDVFVDPIRVEGDLQGKFAAAEFRDAQGDSVVVRFEKNTNAEGQIVRINGSDAYCRRLQ